MEDLFKFFESSKNKAWELMPEKKYILHEFRSDTKHRVEEIIDQLWLCIENPRNEIDNPIEYCTLPFYNTMSSFVASIAIENLAKEYQKPSSASLWSVFIRSTERILSETEVSINISPGTWKWFHCAEMAMAEYYVLAYVNGSISAERAIELSGLDMIDFAELVQETAIERDCRTFDDYLKGKVDKQELPFSEKKSLEFKDLMAKDNSQEE